MIFAPATKMHLRNLIYTYKIWIANRKEDDLNSIILAKLGRKSLFNLENQIKEGKFSNLPEGI